MFVFVFVCLKKNQNAPRTSISLTADGPQRGSRLPSKPAYSNAAILPVVTNDLPISPQFSPVNIYRDATSAFSQLVLTLSTTETKKY